MTTTSKLAYLHGVVKLRDKVQWNSSCSNNREDEVNDDNDKQVGVVELRDKV